MAPEQYQAGTVEIRAATGSPGSPGRVVGVILPAGRVAGDRSEFFVGAGITTPAAGMRLIPEHRSQTTILTFDPLRDSDGTLRIDHRLPDSPALSWPWRSTSTTTTLTRPRSSTAF